MIIATGLTTYAQLAPIESNLTDRVQWQRVEQRLMQQRELERLESPLYRDPVVTNPLGLPCR
jgi:hypothetical protein